MTAADELRRLLDERGIEWDAMPSAWTHETRWKYAGGVARASQRADGIGDLVISLHVTPEQAVEMTLGRGECRNVAEPPRGGGFWPSPHFECSECGCKHVSVDYVDYCPMCGRKVLDE